MSQNQEQIEARLAAYIDGELDPAERAEIEKHLEANPQHKKLIDELMGQRDLLKAIPHEKAPPEIFEQLQGQLERSVLLGNAGETIDRPTRISRWPHFGAIAAIIALTAGLGFLVYKVLPSNKPPGEFAIAPKDQGPVPATMATEDAKESNGKEKIPPPMILAGKTASEDADKLAVAEQPREERASKPGGESLATAAPAPSAAPASSAAPAPGAAPAPSAAPVPGAAMGEISLNASAAPSAPVAREGQATTAPTEGQLAMTPAAASNSPTVTDQPLLNSMNKQGASLGEPASAGGESGAGAGPSVRAGAGAPTPAPSQPQQPPAQNAASLTLIVSTDDPAGTVDQLRTYLTDNGIAFEKATSTPPIQLVREGQVDMTRARIQQVQVQPQPSFAKALPDEHFRDSTKDVTADRRAQAEPVAQKPVLDDGARKLEENSQKVEQNSATTQPAQTEAAATQSNVATAATVAPTTAPAAEQNDLAMPERIAATQTFYCANVTPTQAHELEAALSSRAGQLAHVIDTLESPTATTQAFDLAAAPTTAPATQPAADVAPALAPTDQVQPSPPAAITGNDLQFQQQVPPAQTVQSEPKVGLYIVVRPDVDATTQPATAPATQP